MQKRIIIVHGFASTPNMYWFPWLKDELEKQGYLVETPQMPNPLTPKIEEWIPFLSGLVGVPDENTYFIGHSIGCQAILRYLESLIGEVRVGGAVFVAPFLVLPEVEKEIVKPWVSVPINFEKVKAHLPKSVAIFSDDDLLIPIENKELFERKLGSKTVLVKKHNHFVTVRKLPLVLEELGLLI